MTQFNAVYNRQEGSMGYKIGTVCHWWISNRATEIHENLNCSESDIGLSYDVFCVQ